MMELAPSARPVGEASENLIETSSKSELQIVTDPMNTSVNKSPFVKQNSDNCFANFC